jgi:hypothetical protein
VFEYILKYDTNNISELSILITEFRKRRNSIHYIDYANKFEDFTVRYGSYCLLQKTKSFKNEMRWFPSWQSFYKSDMISSIQNFVGQNDINTALMLWRRHCNLENMQRYISVLLEQIPFGMKCEWIVLIANQFRESLWAWDHPDQFTYLQHLDHWIFRTCETLECSEESPKNALFVLRSLAEFEFCQPRTQWTPNQTVIQVQQHGRALQYKKFPAYKDLEKLQRDLEAIVYLQVS